MSIIGRYLYSFVNSPLGRKLCGKPLRRMMDQAGQPAHETQPEDIFLVSFPKSGSTWLQNLVAGLQYGIDPGLAPDSLIQDLVPYTSPNRHYRRYQTPTVFKTHGLPQPQYRRVVYLVRDGRDVLVSYHHFNRHFENGRAACSLEDMILKNQGLWPCAWHEHVRAWRANPFNAQVLPIRYRDLWLQPHQAMRAYCEFAGLDRTDEQINRVIDQCQFNNLKRQEQQSGMSTRKWPSGGQFYRKGRIGAFREEMPPTLQFEFVRRYGDLLKSLGFPLSMEDQTVQEKVLEGAWFFSNANQDNSHTA